METNENREKKQKHVLFIYSYNELCIPFKVNNNSLQYESWLLIRPTAHAPSAVPRKSGKTMFDDDP